MDLRNKNIAHDENAYSQALPVAIINGPEEPYKIAKIVSVGFHSESLNPSDYKNLFNLVRRAFDYTENQIDMVCDRITSQLVQLSFDELLKMDPVTYTPPGQDAVSKTRVTYY